MTSQSVSSDFKLLDFRYVNRSKYEYSDLEKVNARQMISNCYYAYDANRKYLYYFETPRVRTLTEVYKVGDRFMLDLVVPLGSLFMDYLVSEDEINISATVENSINWFGSQIPPEIATEKYKSSLVLRSGGEDPVFRVNIPSYRGKPVLEVYDNMRRPIDISRIKADMEVACICQKVGIRFSNTTFSGEYDCFKIKITQQQLSAPRIPTGYVFNDESNGGEDEVDVRGYAERLVSNTDTPDDDLYNTNDPNNFDDLPDELSETDSVLNELEEVDFTDGEQSETDDQSETSNLDENNMDMNNMPGYEFDENNNEVELTDEDLEGLEEVVVEEEDESENEYDEPEITSDNLTADDISGLEEVTYESSEGDAEEENTVDLDTGSEADYNDIGLEEFNITGDNISVEQISTDDTGMDNEFAELGLESLDLTPSKKQQNMPPKPNNMVISELTDDMFNDI